MFEAGEASPASSERDLSASVEARSGIRSEVFARSLADLEAAIAANPFPDVARDRPSRLLVLFCREPPSEAELKRVAEGYDGPERLAAVGRELFIDYPEGQGRSTLDPAMARLRIRLPLDTRRNWNTVTKLAAMLS